jgi:hypothetical protein
MPAKVDIFKDGGNLGQPDIVLTDIQSKVSKKEDPVERARALLSTLETLKLEFVTTRYYKTSSRRN